MRRNLGREVLIAVGAIGAVVCALFFAVLLTTTSDTLPATNIPSSLITTIAESNTDDIMTDGTPELTIQPTIMDEASQATLVSEQSNNGENITNTVAATDTIVPSVTPTNTSTETPTATSTSTNTPEPTLTDTATPTETPTDTATETETSTPTELPTETSTSTSTATETETETATPTNIATETPTETVTNTATATPTNTSTETPLPTVTNTETATSTNTATETPTATATNTETATPTNTSTETPTATATNTETATATPTNTSTATPSPTATDTLTPSITPTASVTPSPTATSTSENAFVGIIPTLPPSPTVVPFDDPTRTPSGCDLPNGWTSYIVQVGDTLFAISLVTDSTVDELRFVNCIDDIDNITAGDELFVPIEPISAVTTAVPSGIRQGLAAIGCTSSDTQITSPIVAQRVSGTFTLFGTATRSDFQYYKIEIRPDFADIYNFYSDSQTQVVNGVLGQINTEVFGEGLHWVRLSVVDTSASIPADAICEIPMIFE